MPIKKLTSAVDTMAGPCEDETTTLDTTMADHSGLAWGADDDDDEPQRRSWEDAGSAAAVILVGGVAAAVAVYVAIASSHHNDVAVSAPSARVAVTPPSAPSVVTTVTEPPVTVTVTPATTPAPTTAALNDGDGMPPLPTTQVPKSQDDRYVDALRQHGIAVYDRSRANDQSHWICGQAANGRSATDIATAMRTSRIVVNVTVPQSEFLVTQAIYIYCPQYGGNDY